MLVTTDYVLDETLTLLRTRGYGHRVQTFLARIVASPSCHVEWILQSRFETAQQMFVQYDDNQWSFTDCTSFIVMNELGIHEAFTSDNHFEQAGFELLLTN